MSGVFFWILVVNLAGAAMMITGVMPHKSYIRARFSFGMGLFNLAAMIYFLVCQ